MVESMRPLFEGAYLTHRAPLFRWLVATTRDADLAEDVTHEAFLRLAREMDNGRPPDNAGAWLHRVAANLVVSAARHRVVVERSNARIAMPDAGPSPEIHALDEERSATLRRLLDDLTATERTSVLLAAQGFSGLEIAARIGRSEAATRTLLCRTRAKLRANLSSGPYAVEDLIA